MRGEVLGLGSGVLAKLGNKEGLIKLFDHSVVKKIIGIDKSDMTATHEAETSITGGREALVFLVNNLDTRVFTGELVA